MDFKITLINIFKAFEGNTERSQLGSIKKQIMEKIKILELKNKMTKIRIQQIGLKATRHG